MGKYYVTVKTDHSQNFQQVVNAKNLLDACVQAWLRIRITLDSTSWRVSERGFDKHERDVSFEETEVVRAIENYQKKRK